MRLLQRLQRLSPTALVALAFMAMGLLLVIILTRVGLLAFKKEIDVLSFIVVVGFSITIFQLGQNYKTQEEKFISDYLSKLYTDKDLSGAFHDLVETYENLRFAQFNERATAMKAKEERLRRREPIFEIFDDLQGYRKNLVGSRYYHPDCFQGSEEERRLDGLLGYLDIVGYHFHHGIIPMNDLAAMLNYQLATLNGRDVIKFYLGVSASEGWFANTDIQKQSGAVQVPFLYLRNMLVEYQRYNEENRAKLKKDQNDISRRNRQRYGL
jgi:hypothetical protein